jgi:hypothetical protein
VPRPLVFVGMAMTVAGRSLVNLPKAADPVVEEPPVAVRTAAGAPSSPAAR